MNKKKILFTDLDGTLLNSQKQISEKTHKYLSEFLLNGNYLVLSSGRDLNSVADVQREIGLDLPGMFLIGYNGGQIYDCSRKKTLYKVNMKKEKALRILKIAAQMGVYAHTYSESHIISPYDCRELSYYTKVIHTPVIYSADFSETLTADPYKCLAINFDDRNKLESLKVELHKAVAGLSIAFSGPYYLDILPAASGKGAALIKLCEILKIPVINTIAAGDEENDASMLACAGVSIAMRNGSKKLQDDADIISDHDNNHDGLIGILKKIF